MPSKGRKENKCKARCHPDRPHMAKGLCCQCYAQQYQKRDEVKERYARIRQTSTFKDKRHNRELLKKYGIDLRTKQALIAAQMGLCAINGCTNPATETDHNHSTGKVRAILCERCNVTLGKCQEDTVLLGGMIAYLDLHK